MRVDCPLRRWSFAVVCQRPQSFGAPQLAVCLRASCALQLSASPLSGVVTVRWKSLSRLRLHREEGLALSLMRRACRPYPIRIQVYADLPLPTGGFQGKRYSISKMLAEWSKPQTLDCLYFGLKVLIAFLMLKVFAVPHALHIVRKLGGWLNVYTKVFERTYS